MKVLLVHNAYGKFSGEESVVAAQASLLRANGHEVLRFDRSSSELRSLTSKCKAFLAGIHNPVASRKIANIIDKFCPHVVHIHNLFPLISPAILPRCRRAGIPIVMTLHNYRLNCPNGLHMTRGQVCERCYGGREWWCLLRNCEDNFFKSLGYALRNYTARVRRMFHDNVTMYACLTEFHKQRLIESGLPESRISILPNICNLKPDNPSSVGNYIGFVGRVSYEKGIDSLLQCAKILGHIPFHIAGDDSRYPRISANAPSNLCFRGFLAGDELNLFRSQMRIAVMPSVWYETFGLALAEAALYGKPVVASRLGAMAEIVDDGRTGLLFEPGNVEDLAEKIRYLWDRPYLCKKMGAAGREKALREYSAEKYYERLMAVYEKAITLGPLSIR